MRRPRRGRWPPAPGDASRDASRIREAPRGRLKRTELSDGCAVYVSYADDGKLRWPLWERAERYAARQRVRVSRLGDSFVVAASDRLYEL
jgi:hypothetical protein